MPRSPRYSLPGIIYHVIMRGNNKQLIYISDEDRYKFCLLLQEGVERFGHRILAFCMMSNHVHLAIQLGSDVLISKIIQNLTFRYCRYFNHKHSTVGHLFQGRFKSIMVNGYGYLRQLIRYIHLNPVRAGITSDPIQYPWSSHQAYLMQKDYMWLARDIGLQFFGESKREAVSSYEVFIAMGLGKDEEIDFKKGFEADIIGDANFIEKIITNCNHQTKHDISLNVLLKTVANRYELDVSTFLALGKTRKASKIRAVTTLLARQTSRIKVKDIADTFGVSSHSISQAATRLEAELITSDLLKNEIAQLKSDLSIKNANA